MALNVFTNVSSLNAQRNLNSTSLSMSKSLQRLSSGMRINTASDDAAGLAISNGLQSQVRGLNQAIRNAGDALSLMGTAEGAMVEQGNILQRMRELAVQAASDTNNSTNRNDLNAEASQLKAELERIARTTQFNGNNLLDGTFQSKDLQVGANATGNDRISISFSSTRATAIGAAYVANSSVDVSNVAMAAGDIQITPANGTAAVSVGASTADGVSHASSVVAASALAKANAINAQSHLTGVTAEATTTKVGNAAQGGGAFDASNMVTINGVDVSSGVTTTGALDGGLVASINSKAAQTGVTASMDASGVLSLEAADGRNITVTTTGAAHTRSGLDAAAGTTQEYGQLSLRSTDAFTLTIANATRTNLSSGAVSQSSTENDNAISLTSKSNAQLAVRIVDVALGQINSRRASIGALTNRLNTTIQNLSTASENAAAANSRILDADFAAETANMSRNQILQQAGVAILSQANQAPQLALSLLR